MPYLLLCVSIILCVCRSATYNYYAKEEKPNAYQVFKFNAVSYALAMILLIILSIGGTISLPTVLCALAYAVVVVSLQSLMVVAMKTGSMSTISLLNLYGMVIPALAGPIFWNEPFGIIQTAGLLFMILSIFFLREKNEGEKTDNSWILLGGLCFLLSGLAGVMEKIHQSTYARAERSEFLAIAYCAMLLISLLSCIVTRKQVKASTHKKRFWGVSVSVGLMTGLYGSVNLFLAGALNSLVYYPIANGGALLLTVLLSVVLFREKPTKTKIIGFIIGLISVVLLCIPTV